jgi:SusD family.
MKTIFKLLLLLTVSLTSCNENFLDKKPNKSIVIPSTLKDLQALLDNAQVMNIVPALGLNGTDDLFTNEEGFAFLNQPIERNTYTWAKDLFQGSPNCSDWNIPYQQVFYANVVLEALKSIDITEVNQQQWKEIKGSALFFRAHAFYQLAQLFASPYAPQSADLGIPLRLSPDVNAKVFRASISETYNQIIVDLEEAKELLPLTAASKTRPTKSANKALLARTYLTMGEYSKAEQCANDALLETSFLLNYNTLSTSSTRPIPRMNDEILFYSSLITYRFTTSSFTYVDTTLYSRYSTNDLRRSIFFRQRTANRYNFKGNYTANASLFGGIANDEMYLTRSECRVRNGNIQGALNDLNALLIKRWRTGTFVPIITTDPAQLLAIILLERQKELVFRGTRWTDLRRLNSDPNFAKTLSRKIQGIVYTIAPGDARYTLSIPDQEINTSGIQQNIR